MHMRCVFSPNPRYTKSAAKVKTDDDLLKGVRKYTRTARKAWEALSIPEDQEIDLEGLHTDHSVFGRVYSCFYCLSNAHRIVSMGFTQHISPADCRHIRRTAWIYITCVIKVQLKIL